MISQELRNTAFVMRKEGRSYNYIRSNLGISKSTLSDWFTIESWSNQIKQQNQKNIVEISRNRILKLNEGRKEQIKRDRSKAKKEAEDNFGLLSNDPLFIGGLMIYLGEGDKSSKSGRVGVANVDHLALKIFKNFLQKFCNIQDKELRVWILCYPDNNQEECRKWWSKQLEIPEKQFYKTQVIQGKHKVNKLIYDVGNIIMTRMLLKVKILRWIELMSDHLASIV